MRIFEWHRNYAVAQQWVGVVQVPGLSVEILPKVAPDNLAGNTEGQHFSRKNLVYMLTVAGKVPLRQRDLAKQTAANAPLHETLIAIFADQLHFELNRGRPRSYIRQRENLSTLKGKLQFSQQLTDNLARKDRFAVEHSRFSPDTTLSRIFKAACRHLVKQTRTRRTEDQLGMCLMFLDGVEDVPVGSHLFDDVTINRQNERFADLFEFCRLLFAGNAPTGRAGDRNTFSLLFDMNSIYEKFVAKFLARHVLRDELADCRIHTQSPPRLQHLVYRAPADPGPEYAPRRDGDSTLRLLPDIVIERAQRRLVIDTKWTRLSPTKSPRCGVTRNALFQLFAYAHNYEARHNVLLYPGPNSDVPEQTFDLPRKDGASTSPSIHAMFVNLNRNLASATQRRELAVELRELIQRLLPVDSSSC